MKFPQVLEVNVTQRDIDHGAANDCHRCPLARAVSRKLLGYWVSVGNKYVTIYHRSGDENPIHTAASYNLSPEAKMFVKDFDLKTDPEHLAVGPCAVPGTYKLNLWKDYENEDY